MHFPPIKADRCLLWITLHPDETAPARAGALRAALKPCRLHPLDGTAGSELVIVDEAALEQHLDAVRGALGERDVLHVIRRHGERLSVAVIAGAAAARRPPWPVAG